jgi:hypothetical protein
MDAVLSFFPEEERVKYSAMTGQSLYCLGRTDLKHKILAVVETSAESQLRLEAAAVGELTIASTNKDHDRQDGHAGIRRRPGHDFPDDHRD